MCTQAHSTDTQLLPFGTAGPAANTAGAADRRVLQLPVRNNTRVGLIQWDKELGGFEVAIRHSNTSGPSLQEDADNEVVYARKVVLATGIQVRMRERWDVKSLCWESGPCALWSCHVESVLQKASSVDA